MELFDFAIQQEIEGEQLYRSLADQAPCVELRETLLLLASEEVKHRHLIESLRQGATFATGPVDVIIAHPQATLQAISESLQKARIGFNHTEFFRKAIELEVSSEEFYSKLVQDSKNPHQKALFLRLAGEERMHQALLEGIIHVLDLTLPSSIKS